MFLHMKPWIQALLLLSPRRPPGFDQLVEELRSRFGGEQARSWSEDVLGTFRLESKRSRSLLKISPPGISEELEKGPQ
jgi:hypothetical protein